MRHLTSQISLVFVILLASSSSGIAGKTLGEYRVQYQQRQAEYHQSLNRLAQELERNGQQHAAESVRAQIYEETPGAVRFRPLPKKVREPLPATLPTDRFWQRKLRSLQEAEAVELYKLSQEASRDGEISFTYRMLRQAALLNSDYPIVRKMLGYIQQGDEWLTPFEADKKRRGEIWNERFGWIAEKDLPRYEKGERRHGARWIPAAQENQLRTDFRAAWEIRTEHWLVKTNHSHEKGVEIARKLEEYYQFFINEFPGLFNNRTQMKKLFAVSGTAVPRINRNPFVVHYYRNKNDYVDALERRIPGIGGTNGLYQQQDEISYFFHDPKNQDESSIYHEATHQILFESRPVQRDIALERHFWVVEGFACYMESYQNVDGEISLGDARAIRFDNARARLIVDKIYFELALVSERGMQAFQRDRNVPILYSQASGQVHFFLHADEGKYRDAFIEFLSDVYASRRTDGRDVKTLEQLTGVKYSQLDKEYILYIQRQAQEIAFQEQAEARGESDIPVGQAVPDDD